MISSLRLGLGAAALLAACSIRLEQDDGATGNEGECLELFETCVELAGESPGCTEVFQFCQGSAAQTGTGGGPMPGSCEQDYIECLASGSSAASCQPLLDACMPAGSTTGCDQLEPTCGMTGDAVTSLDSSSGNSANGETACKPGDPGCGEGECDTRYEDCLSTLKAERACSAIRESCMQEDCESALGICFEYTEDEGLCGELTGCDPGPPMDATCEELLADCESQGVNPSECGNLYPERPECFPGPEGCSWYEELCHNEFDSSFCNEGRQACEVGILPEVFECLYIESACGPADLSESACSQALESCQNGFFDAVPCSMTSLAEDPLQWLNELAACNGWM